MVSAALRLQPLLARAHKLRAKDQAAALTSVKNMNGEASIVNLVITVATTTQISICYYQNIESCSVDKTLWYCQHLMPFFLRLMPKYTAALGNQQCWIRLTYNWCVCCTAGVLAESEIIKQDSLVNALPMDRLQMLTQVLQGSPNNEIVSGTLC